MAGVEDLFKGEVAKGLAVGLGAAALVPIVLPVLAGVGRPAARAALKGGIIVYEKSRETLAELGEMMDDLVAEVRAEMQQQQAAAQATVQSAAEKAAETAESTQPGGE